MLTTCSESFHGDWYRNSHPAGERKEGGIDVRRFTVDRADPERFAHVNRLLLETPPAHLKVGCSPIDATEARDFIKHNINSLDLLVFLRKHADDFNAFLFLPYLYGTTLQGWKLVREKTVLQPCLHDESYAYLPRVAEMMRGVGRIAFNSIGEMEVAKTLYGPGIIPRSDVVGSAIDWPRTGGGLDTQPVAGFSPEKERYALYVGRRSKDKNYNVLLRAYARFRELAPSSTLKLVAIGPGSPLEEAGLALDLGLVNDAAKERLLANCTFLAQPSAHESYSRAMMEAWAAGRPVVVNGRCLATAQAVRETGAGWLAESDGEWQRAFLALDRCSEAELDAVGAKAAQYVRHYASWDAVLDRYESAFAELNSKRHRHARWEKAPNLRAVHQFIPVLKYGTASAQLVLSLRDEIQHHGYRSDLIVEEFDPEFASETPTATAEYPAPTIVHEVGDGRGTEFFNRRQSRAVLIDKVPDKGAATAFTDLVFADPNRWNIAPDPTLMEALQDGRTNILFVGAIAEHNAQIALLDVFGHYLTLDFTARLIMAGDSRTDDVYLQRMQESIDAMGLAQRILVPGLVSEAALAAFYRTAGVYCSLSAGTSAGLPLLEAMWFDLPVCALRTDASAAILGDAGILIESTTDKLRVAGLWKVLAADEAIRRDVIEAQRRRRKRFSPLHFCEKAASLVESITR